MLKAEIFKFFVVLDNQIFVFKIKAVSNIKKFH